MSTMSSGTPRALNIILFGETGVGKSSVVNLIAGEQVADTSVDGEGCTLESQEHTLQVAKRTFNIWDTVGLGEPTFSTFNDPHTTEKMSALIQRIKAQGELDLLLFCMRGSRVTRSMVCNYNLLFDVLCEKRVPIAVVVTHLENEKKMEEWWSRNEKFVGESGLKFIGHACVTGLREDQKAAEGRDSLEHLLLNYNSGGHHLMSLASVRLLGSRLRAFPHPKDRQSQLEWQLRSRCGMQDNNARQLAQTLSRLIYHSLSSTQDYQSKSPDETRSSFNVLLFGEAGVGKSSVLNLIAGKSIAMTSANAWGTTLESQQYTFQVAEHTFSIWDTIGLAEPILSGSNHFGPIEKAYGLIQQIEAKGGLDLLLFCISASRVTQTMLSNYRLFFEVLCGKRIPISVVVTRLEDETRMEEWWVRNEEHITQSGLRFGGHACITGKPGDPKAAEGLDVLEHLLLGFDDRGRYPMPISSDLPATDILGLHSSKLSEGKRKYLERLLNDRCMMNIADARRLAGNLIRIQSFVSSDRLPSHGPVALRTRMQGQVFQSHDDDSVVFLVGPSEHGKSTFLSAVTQFQDFVHLPSTGNVRSIRCRLTKDQQIAEERKSITFVRTPSFVATPEAVKEMNTWLKKSKSKFSHFGTIYMHEIETDSDTNDKYFLQRQLDTFAATFPLDLTTRAFPQRLHCVLGCGIANNKTDVFDRCQERFWEHLNALRPRIVNGWRPKWETSIHPDLFADGDHNTAWKAVEVLFSSPSGPDVNGQGVDISR